MLKIVLLIIGIGLVSACDAIRDELDLSRIPIPNEFQLANHGFYNSARLSLIDQVGDNLLFRGNLPIQDGVFVFDKLIKDMRASLDADSKPIDEGFELVMVSLINEKTEAADLQTEQQWFSDNSDKGRMIHLPIYGSLVDPARFPSPLRNELAKRLKDHDKLPQRIDIIRELLEQQGNRQKVVYVHCEAGVDRTGEVMGAYSMRYLNMSYQTAIDKNAQIADRQMSRFATYGMRWYGYYLIENLGLTSVGVIE